MSTARDRILEGVPLLQLLNPEEHANVSRLFRETSCGFGEVVVREGSPAEAFYIVETGRLRVVKQVPGGEEVMLNVLTSGDVFGEIALLEGGVHTASVRCSTDATLLVLDGGDFKELVARTPRLLEHLTVLRRLRTLHNFLRQFSGLGNLPLPVLRAFMERLVEVSVSKGQLVIREGEPPGPMYAVREGKLRAFVSEQGREKNLSYLRAGDFFGELSVLRGAPRAASVEAITDGTLLSLSAESLAALAAQYPEFRAVMDERAAQYNAAQEARIPLDFSEELLPAEASVANRVDIASAHAPSEGAPTEAPEGENPFVDERGHFRKTGTRIRRMPFVQQIDEMDCGAASMAMICRYFGRREPLARIRQLVHVSSDGTSLRAISTAAEELGLAAQPVKVSRANLDRMPLPAIVHWEGNHWMVLFDVQPTHVRLADPALGRRKMGREEFERNWSGYAALFDRTEAFQPSVAHRRSSLAWLNRFFRPYRKLLVGVFLLAVLSSLLEMTLPVFTQVVVDRVVGARDASLLQLLGFGMLAALLFMTASNIFQRYLLSAAAVKIDTAILDFLTRTLLDLPMSYFSTRRTGDIQRRLAGATEVREFLVQSGVGGALSLVQLIAMLGFMAYYSGRLLLIFLLTVPAYAVLMMFAAKVLKPILALLEETHGTYVSRQIDAIKGIEAVKSAAAEEMLRDQMLREFTGLADQQFRGNFAMLTYESGVELTALLAQVLFIWAGAGMVMRGELTIGRFVAFNALVAMAYGPVVRLLGLWDRVQRSGVLLDRLADVFDNEPEQGRDHSQLNPVRTLEGHIQFVNVGFQYGGPESPKILEGISLDVPPGQTVAIVGRSGSGKTTMVKCLSGLLQPTGGTILFDGIDLQTLRFRDLRRQIGVVLQENYLFDDTIARNIALGERQTNDDRVVWASRTANAHDFITRLPLQYDTRVGETGLAISGGQRQRIAIARAIYSNPPILIFDEATSALDAESEQIIQENLARLFLGRTTFVIAHRLSTIRNADTIVVLDKGRIVEQGTHDELMTSRGLYFYLCSQQLGL